MLVKTVKSLRRVYFNRPPSQERVNFSSYVEEEYHFVRKSYREELNRLNREHGSGR
ncbi:MAG: hypothetical protein K0U98_26845 [Deltaproteobacteria bacterium]|nr:hypothetical protein [Deltaproteobacteria bacterium]